MNRKEITKYERALILGKRAEQISAGAAPTISVPIDMSDAIEIARLELIQKKCPFIVRRILPDNSIMDISANDLIYTDK